MRLLNVNTKKLKTFYTDHPKYAILSHTWLEDHEEVTYLHIQNPEACTHLPGYAKLELTCQQAIKDGFDWVWIDTCCIDKTSSAELSEAINSMFNWYKLSDICYAYLTDVSHDANKPEELCKSRWWTRSWTLQEFLCPEQLVFYDKSWTCLGTKHENSLLIAENIGIDFGVVDGSRRMNTVSVAKRMSWASNRMAKRTEDIAYSLLGIFQINMPLLYGEGNNAFRRLQSEILKSTNDLSLFAWDLPPPQSDGEAPSWHDIKNYLYPSPSGMFVDHPRSFEGSHALVNTISTRHNLAEVQDFNGVIKLMLPLIQLQDRYFESSGIVFRGYYIALLPCAHVESPGYLIGILLLQSVEPGRYERSRVLCSTGTNYSGTLLVPVRDATRAQEREIWIVGAHEASKPQPRIDMQCSLVIEYISIPPTMYFVGAIPHWWKWDATNATLTCSNHMGVSDRLVLSWHDHRDQSVLCASLKIYPSVPMAGVQLRHKKVALQDVHSFMETALREQPEPEGAEAYRGGFGASISAKQIFNHAIFTLQLVSVSKETVETQKVIRWNIVEHNNTSTEKMAAECL